MADLALVVFAAAIVGGLARALLPYLRKLAAAEADPNEVPFQKRFIFTAILAIVTSAIVAVLVFPTIIEGVPDPNAKAGLAGVFVYGFLATWGANDLFNQVISTGVTTANKTTKKEVVVAKKIPDSEKKEGISGAID